MEKKGLKKNRYSKIVLFILLLILLDQILKIWVLHTVPDSKVIKEGILSFTITRNTGGAFGIGQNDLGMFILSNIIVLGIIIRFMVMQKEQMDNRTRVVLSLVLAGGFSNLLDRLFRGYVVDFIDFTNFPNFNLADIYIVVGWVAFCFIIAHFTWYEVRKKTIKGKNDIERTL